MSSFQNKNTELVLNMIRIMSLTNDEKSGIITGIIESIMDQTSPAQALNLTDQVLTDQVPKAQASTAQASMAQASTAQASTAQAPNLTDPKLADPKLADQASTTQASTAQAPNLTDPKLAVQVPKAKASTAQAPNLTDPKLAVQVPKAKAHTVQASTAQVSTDRPPYCLVVKCGDTPPAISKSNLQKKITDAGTVVGSVQGPIYEDNIITPFLKRMTSFRNGKNTNGDIKIISTKNKDIYVFGFKKDKDKDIDTNINSSIQMRCNINSENIKSIQDAVKLFPGTHTLIIAYFKKNEDGSEKCNICTFHRQYSN